MCGSTTGDTLPADLVIAATGVRPNIDFLEGSGIRTDYGVLVDTQLATSAADVYAAGDVAQGLDFSTGQYTVQAIQPTAADHGRIAASNMAGPHAGASRQPEHERSGHPGADFQLLRQLDGC